MANPEHLAILNQGVETWNAWRTERRKTLTMDVLRPDLKGADLSGAYLSGAYFYLVDFQEANLSGTSLIGANFTEANLNGANLSRARLDRASFFDAFLHHANLSEASLERSKLIRASLVRANLYRASFYEADLTLAEMEGASFVETDLRGAQLRHCRIFGVSVWGAKLEGALQKDLIVAGPGKPGFTVDNLEVAQFIYLLLDNPKIREVIDTITSKVVLILGRFTPKRKDVLDQLRDNLRAHNLVPVLFDFDQPTHRNTTETVTTLARMARFIIADLTHPRSIPQELQAIVPDLPSVPVQPLLHRASKAWGMFPDFQDYAHVLEPFRYHSTKHLLHNLEAYVIAPAVQKAEEIAMRRAARR